MTNRLDELLTDEPEQEAGDVSRMIQQHLNNLRRALRPEVQALRDRVRELEAERDRLLRAVDDFWAMWSIPEAVMAELDEDGYWAMEQARERALRATLEGEATK